jgi:hypothetical protein
MDWDGADNFWTYSMDSMALFLFPLRAGNLVPELLTVPPQAPLSQGR